MNLEDIKRNLPHITDLALLREMLEKGTPVVFEQGESLIEPGQFVKMVPIVMEGAIKILRVDEEGKELFLYHLQPGDTCAISLTCCTAFKPSEIKAVAEEETVVLSIPVQQHEEWTDRFKQWKDFVANTYQNRFNELLLALDSVAFKKMDERLIRYLLTKKKQQQANELQTTHQEIANELGTSREVISRLLKQLERKKWIELGRNIIYVRDDFETLTNQFK